MSKVFCPSSTAAAVARPCLAPVRRLVGIRIAAALRPASATVLAALLCAGCERPPSGPPAHVRAEIAHQMARLDAARAANQPVAVEIYAGRIIERFPDSPEAAALRAQLPALRADAARWRAERERAELWRYTAAEHPDGYQLMAELSADAAPDAPPLRLMLRRHPRLGQAAYLLIDGGADFACQNQCTLQLVFDEAPARAFAVRRALDNVPPALFLRDDNALYAALESSDQLRLDLPLASGARVTYRFDIGGYQPERMQGDGSQSRAGS